VRKEHEQLGFAGRFGAGLPRISDGQLLFVQHMVAKMRPVDEGGGRIAVFLNGSPLFTGSAGSGESEIRRYLDRVSGPLLDRIDIQIEVDAVPVREISTGGAGESSAVVGERVRRCRETQLRRYEKDGIHCNAQLDAKLSRKYCRMTPEAEGVLHVAVERMGMSMRAYGRVIKVARTIADLAGADTIAMEHIAEAIQYRELDGKYWQ
jgi:predicted ATPase with chaperone activity